LKDDIEDSTHSPPVAITMILSPSVKAILLLQAFFCEIATLSFLPLRTLTLTQAE